ncbi:MAG: methyltransferase [Candidatus Aenigmarchaeota archaeon]|nr:methyltransferase [Candidatus Aenigmarchaeota archaeon]
MREKKKHLEGTLRVLRESQKETGKYYVEVLGRKFVVYPGVFSPKYFNDTKFFAREVHIRQGERFLEIGPGTGVISVFAALKGAKVVCIDINAYAIENTKENAKINRVKGRITTLHGNLYDPLPKDAKFDTIFWNIPFGYVKKDKISVLEKAVFDPEYRSTKSFVFGANMHLGKNGRLLIGFSTTLGHFSVLRKFLEEAGFEVKLLAQTESVETRPVKFELFEARKNQRWAR